MIDDLAHFTAVVLGWPLVVMVGAMFGWSVIESMITVLLWPLRNKGRW